MDDRDRKFWMMIRSALLSIIEAVEVRFEINPKTSELRKFVKAWMRLGINDDLENPLVDCCRTRCVRSC